jgi:beta-lactamase superfamily II metal-dependent hydrolase
MLFDGIEVDVLSVGDADCIIVTQWNNGFPHRVLIDGGSGAGAAVILDFLLSRGYTHFGAVLCTHLHNDHARGLIRLVKDSRITFSNGWMHDIHKHVSPESLRRASSADDGVKEVVEATKELAGAFVSRGISPKEPFAGMSVAGWPNMRVLGPSFPYYNRVLQEFTKVRVPAPQPLVPLSRPAATLVAMAGLGGIGVPPRYPNLATMFPPPPLPGRRNLVPLGGALAKSSVGKNPSTQPYNNTSVILGVDFRGEKLLFTADAGSEALSNLGPEWNPLLYLGVPHHGSDGNLSQRDIERFCPKFAIISAKGDSSHPSRAIVSGLVKVGTKVGSTHEHGNLWFYSGNVPARLDYRPIEYLTGTGSPEPLIRR